MLITRLYGMVWLGTLLAAAGTYIPASAQPLHDAFEGAWSRQPAAIAASARADEFAAKRDAADALFPEPPSFKLGYRSDQPNQNYGTREWEGGISLPIWTPGARGAAQSVAQAETEQFEAGLRAQRWRLAGEVREAYWLAQLAETERRVALRKVEETVVLAHDVARRVAAGELARTDLNQARGAEQVARTALADVHARSYRAVQGFLVLTGTKALPDTTEIATTAPADLDRHPQLAAAQRVVAAARAKLSHATKMTRDAPELELGVRRERATFGERYANSVIVAIKVPFATDARNQPRITGANAELIEAQATLQLEGQRIAADIDMASVELEQVREAEVLAAERFRFAADTQALFNKAFALGELDFPSRLRADSERFDAELALVRSHIEAGRAISRLNQALGLIP